MQMGRLSVALAILTAAGVCAEIKSKPHAQPEPKLSSIYPACGKRGTVFEAELRGSDLAGAHRVMLEGSGIEARILGIDAEPPVPDETAKKDRVRLQVTLGADAAPGRHEFRVVTPRGISGAIPLQVTAEPVLHEAPPIPLRQFPLVINGRIAKPGQTDSYCIEAAAVETLTFEATSFSDRFDPSATLYEPSDSCFHPHMLNQVASDAQ